MIYGYARVSTKGQDKYGNSLPDQEKQLRKEGCEVIYHDSFTGTKMDRPEFSKLMSVLKSGDRLVVTKLDRFARTTAGGIATINELLDRGVSVHIINMGLIDNTPTGRLIVTVLLAFAEFERNMIVERTSAGKAIARATKPGWREGRKEKILSKEEILEFNEKIKKGEMTITECCKNLGISRTTWYSKTKTTA
jgi:DNA invertase Pin-like site-specific DNA recombinase